MSTNQRTPAERPLNGLQAARLAGLTGLPASEFEGHTVSALAERLGGGGDPGLWLVRRVCGQVVKRDPATGIDLPVPYATVEVFDTVCDYWGFFSEPWPWGWLFPVSCRRELVTTVQTDVCGDFCFWIPAFEIEWILRWREERICFPEIFTKPTVADLVTAPQAAALAERLRGRGDREADIAPPMSSYLSVMSTSRCRTVASSSPRPFPAAPRRSTTAPSTSRGGTTRFRRSSCRHRRSRSPPRSRARHRRLTPTNSASSMSACCLSL